MRTQTTQEANRLMEQQHLGGDYYPESSCNDDNDPEECERCGADIEDAEQTLCASCIAELRDKEL